jgi:hypothetical protein
MGNSAYNQNKTKVIITNAVDKMIHYKCLYYKMEAQVIEEN